MKWIPTTRSQFSVMIGVAMTGIMFICSEIVAQPNEKYLLYARKVEQYGNMKKTGQSLAIPGAVLLIAGLAVSSQSSITTTSTIGGPTYTKTTGSPYFAYTAATLGILGTAAGIPLWIVGAKKQRSYQKKFDSLSSKIRLTPQGTGLTISYYF